MNPSALIRIGTRESALAMYQAERVQRGLQQAGYATEIVKIQSEGDIDLVTPLYELGVQGVFTRTLDAALLAGRIDVAVHSMKDVPTRLAEGIAEAAVLNRGNWKDILVPKGDISFIHDRESVARVATGSVRRVAQWLYHFPHHEMQPLRGNVNTRLRKLAESDWQGAIFAAAGLERLALRPEQAIDLDWMLPAPAQGAILVVCRQQDQAVREACAVLHHRETALCVREERSFLRTLQGGCSTPISALVEFNGQEYLLRGNVTAPDGSEAADITLRASTPEGLGERAAMEIHQHPVVQKIRRPS